MIQSILVQFWSSSKEEHGATSDGDVCIHYAQGGLSSISPPYSRCDPLFDLDRLDDCVDFVKLVGFQQQYSFSKHKTPS
jgi:hypothetical protein